MKFQISWHIDKVSKAHQMVLNFDSIRLGRSSMKVERSNPFIR